LKRYDYQYNNEYEDDYDETEYEQQGFWGYLRDKNADLNVNNNNKIMKGTAVAANNKTNKKRTNELHDGYWGNFQDNHLIQTENTNNTCNNNNRNKIDHDNNLDKSSLESSLSATFSLSSSINSLSRFRDTSLCNGDNGTEYDYDIKSSLSSSFREFDYKTPKFKIQARKRDE